MFRATCGIVLCATYGLAAIGCAASTESTPPGQEPPGDDPRGDEAKPVERIQSTGGLTLATNARTPTLQLVPQTPNRLVWNATWGDNAYWILDQYNRDYMNSYFSETTDWLPAGVAGNRLLWQQEPGQTNLWTMDGSGHQTAQHWLTAPSSNHRATGISLALNYNGACYHTDDSQSYWVTWNDVADGTFTVQLIDGTGSVQLSRDMSPPFSGLQALWFGKAADGYNNMLFRTADGTAWIYRLDWSSNSPTGTLSFKQTVQRSGYEAMSMNVMQPPNSQLTIGPTQFYDQVLFANWNGDTAILATLDAQENSVSDTSFSGSSGWTATSYTNLPPTCP